MCSSGLGGPGQNTRKGVVMISRRRFLTVVATSGLFGSGLAEESNAAIQNSVDWQGRAFGTDIRIVIRDAGNQGRVALSAARDTIQRLEKLFSIYDPGSSLSRLNRDGYLDMSPEFSRLVHLADHVVELTGGLFDPTVQPLFADKLATQNKTHGPSHLNSNALVGWHKVAFDRQTIRFGSPGMAMTLNGIAQGFATDRVSEVLVGYGYDRVLVNVGEFRSGSESFSIGVENPQGDILGTLALRNGAVATSAQDGFTFEDGSSHIMLPTGPTAHNTWSVASVVADSAALADGLSTALILTPDTSLTRTLIEKGSVRSVILQDRNGQIHTFGDRLSARDG